MLGFDEGHGRREKNLMDYVFKLAEHIREEVLEGSIDYEESFDVHHCLNSDTLTCEYTLWVAYPNGFNLRISKTKKGPCGGYLYGGHPWEVEVQDTDMCTCYGVLNKDGYADDYKCNSEESIQFISYAVKRV